MGLGFYMGMWCSRCCCWRRSWMSRLWAWMLEPEQGLRRPVRWLLSLCELLLGGEGTIILCVPFISPSFGCVYLDAGSYRRCLSVRETMQSMKGNFPAIYRIMPEQHACISGTGSVCLECYRWMSETFTGIFAYRWMPVGSQEPSHLHEHVFLHFSW